MWVAATQKQHVNLNLPGICLQFFFMDAENGTVENDTNNSDGAENESGSNEGVEEDHKVDMKEMKQEGENEVTLGNEHTYNHVYFQLQQGASSLGDHGHLTNGSGFKVQALTACHRCYCDNSQTTEG